MVPFFGSKITQNVSDKGTKSLFNYMNGKNDTYRRKQEVGLFFDPEKNVHNVYGRQNINDNFNERYIPSMSRNNETPIEQQRVGPGINKGYTNLGSGGFHQGDSRDYIMPKHVDQLRTANNPKSQYNGRILSGMRINQRGMESKMDKNRPERYYKNKPNRYFTTVGSTVAHNQYPEYLLKPTNRKTTLLKNRIAPASSVFGNKKIIHSKVKVHLRLS